MWRSLLTVASFMLKLPIIFLWKENHLQTDEGMYMFTVFHYREIMKLQQISKRLQLHRALMRDAWQWSVDPKSVLVLFFPWLGAKEKHSTKFRELYTNLGLDVLTVKSLPTDFLWPPNSVKLADHILKVRHFLVDWLWICWETKSVN